LFRSKGDSGSPFNGKIMDYEKMYKEALKRARNLYPGVHSHNKAMLEQIFPELAESEDEKIRKLLVWQVHRNIEDETNDLAQSVYDGIKGHDPDIEESIEDWKRCLAWLEKQKEPLPIPNKFSGLKSLMLQYLQSAANRKDDTEIESDTDLWGRKILDYVWKYDEKQKEQKPDWSEEDEKMLDSIIKVVCGVGVQPNGLREKQVSFLKSLRPQYHGDVTMTEAYKMGLEAGKASSWEPSEEQMAALEAATVRYQSTGLESLFEDLKKL
jgi:hypothetical protein